MSRQRKVLFLSPRNRKLDVKRENGQMLLDSWGEGNTSSEDESNKHPTSSEAERWQPHR
jgi:hypothetical protein